MRFTRFPLAALITLIVVGAFTTSSMAANIECEDGQVLDIPVQGPIVGTSCDDIIVANDSNTSIDSGDGDDIVIGGPRVELLRSGSGEDLVYANGSAVVDGEGDDDLIYGSDAEGVPPTATEKLVDALGTEGRSLDAESLLTLSNPDDPGPLNAEDDPKGTPGNDELYGGAGNNTIDGLGGNDIIYADTGDDTIFGRAGNDFLAGGHGFDEVRGGTDDDYIRGDGGGDELFGDFGKDTISYSTAVIPGFTNVIAADKTKINFPASTSDRGAYIDLSTATANNGKPAEGGGDDKPDDGSLSGFENIIGSPFPDYIIGNNSANEIHGGGGTDVIDGRGGNDEIFGGASGDNIVGGDHSDEIHGGPGFDYCSSEDNGDCNEAWTGPTHVVPRDTSKIAVGFTTDTSSDIYRRELYAVGTPGNDVIKARYQPMGSDPDRIVFTETGVTSFEESTSNFEETAGCDYTEVPAGKVICTFQKPLDAIVLAGGAGKDNLSIDNAAEYKPPRYLSPMLLGGPDDDQLSGSNGTDDVLADGPGKDTLNGYNLNDAMLNTSGVDGLDGGLGDDLFLSTALCEGDSLNGNDGDADNSSWIQTPTAVNTNGVQANLPANGGGSGTFGQFSANLNPVCNSGSVGVMNDMENLEGTNGYDRLYGNNSANNLMGHDSKDRLVAGYGEDGLTGNEGSDVFEAGGGDDQLNARHKDKDDINCGTGADEGTTDKGVGESNCGGKLKEG